MYYGEIVPERLLVGEIIMLAVSPRAIPVGSGLLEPEHPAEAMVTTVAAAGGNPAQI